MDIICAMFKEKIKNLTNEIKKLKIREKEEKNFIKKLAIKGKIKRLEDKIKSYSLTTKHIEDGVF